MTTTAIKAALQGLEASTAFYVKELDLFTMEQLTRTPGEAEWSLGQVIRHLSKSALYMQIPNIERCIEQDASRSEAGGTDQVEPMPGKTPEGEAVFAAESFPPIRIQVPASPQYTPEQPETKEELVQGLHAVLDKLREIEPLLGAAGAHSASPSPATVPHPRLGGLTAEEWFLMIEMHYRHHMRQFARLKQELTEQAV